MKQRFVRKSCRIDPDKLAKAREALGASSDSEAVRMAIKMVTDQEETMAFAIKELANPALIFIYSFVLLLLGCAIAIHWSKNLGTPIWIVVCGALLLVIHDLLEGFVWFGIAVRMAQTAREREAARQLAEVGGAVPEFPDIPRRKAQRK